MGTPRVRIAFLILVTSGSVPMPGPVWTPILFTTQSGRKPMGLPFSVSNDIARPDGMRRLAHLARGTATNFGARGFSQTGARSAMLGALKRAQPSEAHPFTAPEPP